MNCLNAAFVRYFTGQYPEITASFGKKSCHGGANGISCVIAPVAREEGVVADNGTVPGDDLFFYFAETMGTTDGYEVVDPPLAQFPDGIEVLFGIPGDIHQARGEAGILKFIEQQQYQLLDLLFQNQSAHGKNDRHTAGFFAAQYFVGELLFIVQFPGDLKDLLPGGFYYSQFSIKPLNPYICTDADGAFPAGDSFVVYPGEDGEPEDSLRLEVFHEALQDVNEAEEKARKE